MFMPRSNWGKDNKICGQSHFLKQKKVKVKLALEQAMEAQRK
jgi:hypothetical protein